MNPPPDPEALLAAVVDRVRAGGPGALADFDASPLAIYVTDPQGVITWFNQACVGFAGRTPTIGEDRWCVTWRLFTDEGGSLKHEECPMAVAIRQQRPVRGAVAFAERPNGVRVEFMPYPTPIFGEDGAFLGAVNILVDTTPARSPEALRAQARKYRRLALSVDPDTAAQLESFGLELDGEADGVPVTH